MSLKPTLIYSAGLSVGSTALALIGSYIISRLSKSPEPRSMNSSDMGNMTGKFRAIKKRLLAEVIATALSFAVSWSWFSWPSLIVVPIMKVVQYAILLQL